MAHHQFPNECGDPHRPHSGEDSTSVPRHEGSAGRPPAPNPNPNPASVPHGYELEAAEAGGSAMMPHHVSHALGAPGGHSPSRRYPAVSRSIPIAIRRNATSATDPDTTTSDDEDDDVRADGNHDGGASAAKDGLLRAPFLGSLPSSRNAEELLSHNDILLPAASLAQEEHNVEPRGVAASYSDGGLRVGGGVGGGRAGYGSLRESNMMGRFLDGPASYRERGTGGIVQLGRNRVRFDASSASMTNESHNSSNSKPPISIGDQLMMHARRRRQDEAGAVSSSDEPQQQPPASSLAAMLESSSLENASPVRMQVESNTVASVPSEYDAPGASMFDDYDDAANPAVLSMSLTGLEVLHSLPRPRGASSRNGFRNGGGHGSSLRPTEPDVLPRDANGQNALLSRSFSDPTPRVRRLDLRQAGEPPTHPSPGLFPGGHVPTSAPTPSAPSFDFHGASLPPAAFVASPIPVPTDAFPTLEYNDLVSNDAARAANPMWDEGTAPPTGHDNPDTEGAFEMDLE